MIFKDVKNLKKDSEEIKIVLNEIKDTLSKDYAYKVKELNETKEYLSNISLRIKAITRTVDNYGNPALKITYEAPQVFLCFDENLKPIQNETFRSINALDLISQEDQLKLTLEINKIS